MKICVGSGNYQSIDEIFALWNLKRSKNLYRLETFNYFKKLFKNNATFWLRTSTVEKNRLAEINEPSEGCLGLEVCEEFGSPSEKDYLSPTVDESKLKAGPEETNVSPRASGPGKDAPLNKSPGRSSVPEVFRLCQWFHLFLHFVEIIQPYLPTAH